MKMAVELSLLFICGLHVKQLLIQIFTVDKQIQKINRCVLQMHSAKITSVVVAGMEDGAMRGP